MIVTTHLYPDIIHSVEYSSIESVIRCRQHPEIVLRMQKDEEDIRLATTTDQR